MRPFARLIVIVSWLVYGARWIAGARSAAKSERVSVYGGGGTWTAVTAVLLLVLAKYGYRLRVAPSLTSAAGAALTVAGLVVSIRARDELGRNWSSDAALVERQELVTTGPYSRVRHPIYSGFLAMAAGTALVAGTVGTFLLVTVQAAFLWKKAQAEDALLAAEYGPAYEAYRERTGAFGPRL